MHNLYAQNYDVIKLTEAEREATEIGIFTVTDKSNEKGTPFSAVVDFDDMGGYTQNSSLEVVVVALYKRAGENVKQGEPIAEISSNVLSELYFSLQNTRSRFEIASQVEKKDKELLKQGVISQRAYQTSYLTMNELKLKMNEIRSTFTIFGISPDNPRGQYGFLVRAQGSGILSVAPTQIGQKIPAFTPYIRIKKPNSNSILLRIRVPQNRSGSVKQGFAVFDIHGEKIGNIETISNVVDLQTNTMSAVARVESKNFRVGEIVEIYIAGNIGDKAVIVPDDCWIKYYDDYIAFILTKEGFQPISIQILEERDSHSVVTSNDLQVGAKLARGSLVILKGIMTGLGGDGGGGHAH
ncbi:nickel-cobalt-cadmium resistance protein [Helicobacter didelphidarum]|uniref:Nickel-cobalt-cadmium resistance protein n=2 Tax=Helicobacter didelphidarum TaxID=2040648 RepID=A0A3D8IRU1_9HELI|nr:nickel-cobalt-cadmium resistance protein [Helicobacter didelphidarum]